MDNKDNMERSTGKFINWITVWGFIFGCIAFNLYVDNRQTVLHKNQYRSQYEQESQRADSLYRENIRLEQHVQELKTTAVQRLSTNQSDQVPKPVVAREL